MSSVTIVQLPTGRSAGKSRVATRKASLDSRPFLLRAPKTSRWLDPSPNCTTIHDVGGGYFCYRFLCYPASSTDYEALKSCEETEQLLGLLRYFCSLQPGLMGALVQSEGPVGATASTLSANCRSHRGRSCHLKQLLIQPSMPRSFLVFRLFVFTSLRPVSPLGVKIFSSLKFTQNR